ncbi:MAG: transcription antitermination factor NusB [Proteobacteria bacterium]|nr:transcription antitermination factor NusB [Pseudomonadota bacterium]
MSKPGPDRLSAARLAAVQALYQMDIAGDGIEDVVAEFLTHRLADWTEDGQSIDADTDLFATLTRGAGARRDDIDALIVGALAEGWTVERLELLLRAVLRVGTFELMARPETPAKVVIDEYIEVAHAFFGKGPPGFVNGVLDRLAHELRPGEFDAP